jgi:hypothetical protein
MTRIFRRLDLLSTVLVAVTAACIRAPEVTPTSQAQSPSPGSDDPARGVVLVHVHGADIDWNAPWSHGSSWTRTLTGLVVAGHKVFVGGWGLRGGQEVEVQKPGAVTRAAARVALFDVDAGLALLDVDDPTFWGDLRPAVLSPTLPKGRRVKLWHALADGMRVEAYDGAVTGFQDYGRFAFVHMKIGQVDLQHVGVSDVVSMDGQVVGLMMGASNTDVFAMASPTVIDFLAEASHVPYRGYAGADIRWQKLSNPALRDSLGLRADEGGVLVSEVQPGGSSNGVLQPGDALLTVDGTKIDSDGTYLDPAAGRMDFGPLFLRRRHSGDSVAMSVLRRGERMPLTLTLKRVPNAERLVPWFGAELDRYAVEGGLVFQRLSREYLLTFGKDWETKAPPQLLEPYELMPGSFGPERAGIVVLTRVLPVPATLGYEQVSNLIVDRINGARVQTVDDVRNAFSHPEGAFHVVTFSPGQGVRRVVIDVQEAKDADESLRAKYHYDR